jgi:hypothetical protein
MVSVLLEGFIGACDEMKTKAKTKDRDKEYMKIASPLDPLMELHEHLTSCGYGASNV